MDTRRSQLRDMASKTVRIFYEIPTVIQSVRAMKWISLYRKNLIFLGFVPRILQSWIGTPSEKGAINLLLNSVRQIVSWVSCDIGDHPSLCPRLAGGRDTFEFSDVVIVKYNPEVLSPYLSPLCPKYERGPPIIAKMVRHFHFSRASPYHRSSLGIIFQALP